MAKGLHGRPEGLNGLGGVRSIDEHDPGRPEERAKDRVLAKLLLGDTSEISAEKLEHQHELQPALMVEDEHRGAIRPEVFLAFDSKIDPRSRRSEVPPNRPHHVDRLAFRAVENPCGHTEPHRWRQAPVEQPRANDIPKRRRSTAREATNRPLPLLRDLGELARWGSEGAWTARPCSNEGKVFVAVRIEVALARDRGRTWTRGSARPRPSPLRNRSA